MDSALMLRNTGLDVGTTGTRQVSVGILWGPVREADGDGANRKTASVPSHLCTFRRLPLPPAGREMRRRVLREELSFSLPFPLEEAAWDYTDQGGEAWVVVAPLDRLGGLRKSVGDSASLDAEPLTYLRAATAAGVASALVIDFGAAKTTFVGIQDGHLEWVRVMMRGGIGLTRELATAYGISSTEAEKRKCERGTELPEARRMLEEALEEALLPSPLPYQKVLICGGGAAMPGLLSLLKDKLGVAPELFPVPPPLSPYQHVPAYGAALAARPNQPRVRLQERREKAPAQAFGMLWVWVGILACLWLFDLELRHQLLVQQEKAARQAFAASLRGYASPGDQSPAKLASQVEERLRQLRSDRMRSPDYVAEQIAALADPFGDAEVNRLVEVSIEGSKIRLEGQSRSATTADQLRLELGKRFPDLQNIKGEPLSSGRFRFIYEGTVPSP